jgi:hypothetical protein
MARQKTTPELIAALIARVPEGFLRLPVMANRVKINFQLAKELSAQFAEVGVALHGECLYDTHRLNAQQIREYSRYMRPGFPTMDKTGKLYDTPIAELRAQRQQQLEHEPDALRILAALDASPGHVNTQTLCQTPDDQITLESLIQQGHLQQSNGLVFDPLRLGTGSIRKLREREKLMPLRQRVFDYLTGREGQTAPEIELTRQFADPLLQEVLRLEDFAPFSIPVKGRANYSQWIRLRQTDAEIAKQTAIAATTITPESWEKLLALCGDTLRPGARDGKTARIRVVARSYLTPGAAKRIGVRKQTLETAIEQGQLISFEDPEGRTRVPAYAVETAYADPEYAEQIVAFETLTAREISLVAGVSYTTTRRRLQRAGISRTEPQWGQVRGRWNLPATYSEFRTRLGEKLTERKTERDAKLADQIRLIEELRQREREQAELERQGRKALRARLMAAFPTWQHEGRADQNIILHVGPPNSGKTYDALNVLAAANSGWYLAPLRLLAFEVFDRLNQRGVYCNLLTGEEYIPIPGATVTAATIEMFNPRDSGECIIIDEAQMLADPDRGWAWTRAMMEARAPEIHIIGPASAQTLIQQMASAAAIPLGVIEHDRLAPIKIAERNWPLDRLPPRTILVAFSRQTVLQLKTELEKLKRRVSVVYGNLPPEVRRKQADRFADGETEICVATDAVGMGLNLPADYVCFYELEKFDGKRVRWLTPAEVQQIGGRAGRFGLSKAGEVGATTKQDLRMVRQLFYTEPERLTYARVAPSVADLEMIPGNFASKLTQWGMLQSIPDALRSVITTADLAERIELAKMLADEEVNRLGLDGALKLVNAPTRISTRAYWYSCARAILASEALPLPPPPPMDINTSLDLEAIETCIACADIYLWLSRRHEFGMYAPEEMAVRHWRAEWSSAIDEALLKRIDTYKRCSNCGKPLPVDFAYGLCQRCYRLRRYSYDEYS